MLLPIILLIIALATAFFFRGRFTGCNAEPTNFDGATREVPLAKQDVISNQKTETAAPLTTGTPRSAKSLSLLPPRIRKQVESSMSAPVKLTSSSVTSAATAIPKAGPTDSEARAMIENMETKTPDPGAQSASNIEELAATAVPNTDPSTIASTAMGNTLQTNSGSDNEGMTGTEAGAGGKKKKKSKGKKSKHHKGSKKEGKDKKKKKKKSAHSEVNEAPNLL